MDMTTDDLTTSSAGRRMAVEGHLTMSDLWPFSRGAAIFDFDGTIADSLDVWHQVDDQFFGRRGLTYAEDYPERLTTLGFEEGARYTIDTYGIDATVEEVCEEWNALGSELYRTSVTLRPGVTTYLEALNASGVPVGLATTNAPDVLASMEERVPLSHLFPVRVHGCEVEHHTKDYPDIYLECARRLGVDSADCVVFEDLLQGILTARAAGMSTVAVLTNDPRQDAQSLQEAADLVLPDWSVLIAAVKRNNGTC